MPRPDKGTRKSRKETRKRGGVDALADFFGPDGPLAAALPGYEARAEQIELAEAIEQAMTLGKPCLTEAGTGVGKTLAYLIPAMRAAMMGKRTVISTHTISLQNQLIEKDIPLVLSLFEELYPHLEAPVEEAVQPVLMKGRGNFLCKVELENARSDLFLMTDPQFKQVLRWASQPDCTGDLADLPFTFSNWSDLTSNPETCRAQGCAFYNSCHYYRMRWAAAESKLIVVNHALFFSDLALRRSDPNSGIIPDYDNVIFDEAHHLEDVATRTFGIEFGSRRLVNLMEKIRHIRGLDIEKTQLDTLEERNASLFIPFLQAGKNEFFFEDVLPGESRAAAENFTSQTCNSISQLQNRLLELAQENEALRDRLEGMARMCGRAREELHLLFFNADSNVIRWGEIAMLGRGEKKEPRAILYQTPISVANILQEVLWNRMQARKGSVVLTSATLANHQGAGREADAAANAQAECSRFSFARARLGVPEDALELVVGSPFDFKQQAMLYVPGHLPPPAPGDSYAEKVIAEIERILRLSDGRAFLLFTSRAMMQKVYDRLSGTLPFPLFKQGDLPPNRLVEAFKASGNGCLLGVQTFWEGVDVQGESLSCVIIDRLPFAVPDSPVTKARTKAIQEAGGDWFRDYSIPQAQIKLKQGFGRLVRTRADRGLVCILDSRLVTRDYGPAFVQYLPPASRASKWPRVEKFWRGELAASKNGSDAG